MAVAPPMFDTEMIHAIASAPSLTPEIQRARVAVLYNLIVLSRALAALAHNTEHTYTKEFQWREIHRTALAAHKAVTGKELKSRFLHTIPDGA